MPSPIFHARVDADLRATLDDVRALRFAGPDAAQDLPDHVRAGSAIRRWGERLVVVQDDVHALAILAAGAAWVTPLALPPGADGRRTFGEALGNKALKMDLEACVTLPDGRLVAPKSKTQQGTLHVTEGGSGGVAAE